MFRLISCGGCGVLGRYAAPGGRLLLAMCHAWPPALRHRGLSGGGGGDAADQLGPVGAERDHDLCLWVDPLGEGRDTDKSLDLPL